jgi:hypothetical protein
VGNTRVTIGLPLPRVAGVTGSPAEGPWDTVASPPRPTGAVPGWLGFPGVPLWSRRGNVAQGCARDVLSPVGLQRKVSLPASCLVSSTLRVEYWGGSRGETAVEGSNRSVRRQPTAVVASLQIELPDGSLVADSSWVSYGSTDVDETPRSCARFSVHRRCR